MPLAGARGKIRCEADRYTPRVAPKSRGLAPPPPYITHKLTLKTSVLLQEWIKSYLGTREWPPGFEETLSICLRDTGV
jgi:hypothetical protein